MLIGLAQQNYHIGNFGHNKSEIIKAIEIAKTKKADLLIFPELSVTGYPPMDLLEREEFIVKCYATIEEIAKYCDTIAALVGGPVKNPAREGKNLFNTAFFLFEGEIRKEIHKSLLPTYDIFDEYRYFEPNEEFEVVSFKGKNLAITICEDLWDQQEFEIDFGKRTLYVVSPMEELAKQHPDLIINIAASPYSYYREETKKQIFTGKARAYHLPVFNVNQVAAQTELIFEGGSLVINPSGEIVDQFPFFKEELRFYNLDEVVNGKKITKQVPVPKIQNIHNALVFGIREYFKKMNFFKATLGLSGGIDSAVTLVLAAEALGPENLKVLLLPSRYSSDHSVTDSIELAKNLGVSYQKISIEPIFDSYKKALEPLFKGLPEDVTEENIQARIRSVLLMALSNKQGYILLNTSNKSEAAVGYTTLYGDMSGGLSVLGDVYKTDVYRLAAYINRAKEIIPHSVINKPPSAELRPGQKDADTLPDYTWLDQVLYQYIELQRPVKKIIAGGFDNKLVEKTVEMINANEYKRFQAPPVLRISSKAFGSGRRMPLVARYNFLFE